MALNPLLKQLVSKSAQKYKGGTSKLNKLKEGRNVIRLIVPTPGQVAWVGDDARFFRDLGIHWIKTESNAKPLVVSGSREVCYGQASALSAAIDAAIAAAYDEDTKKLYSEWRAKKAVIVNVVNRDANDEVQVMELTTTTFGKIMEVAALYDDQGINVFDHASGVDFVITRTGKGLNTQYDVAVMPLAPGKTFKPITADQVNQSENLDDFITLNYFRDGDEQKALNAVATIAGVRVPQISSDTSGLTTLVAATPVAALTSAAAMVADAPTATSVAAPAVASAAPAAAMSAADMDAEIARRAALLVAQQAQQAAAAAAAAAPVTATAAVIEPEMASISDISQDEQDALLAQLNHHANRMICHKIGSELAARSLLLKAIQ
jgi:hypothetical protein